MSDTLHVAYFDRFTIELTLEDALSGSHQGSCDDDVAALLCEPYIRDQLDLIPFDSIRSELREYGAWSYDELAYDGDNLSRILWIACGNIREEQR